VYEGYENFTFKEVDYEITDRDIKFIEFAKLPISHEDFEKVIDIFEKVAAQDMNQSMQYLVTNFHSRAGAQYEKRITKPMLETIY